MVKSFFEKHNETGLDIEYISNYYDEEESKKYFTYLNMLSYDESATVIVFNKEYKIPRHQIAFGDEGIKYKYSNKTVKALYWTPELLEIKEKIEKYTCTKFNFCLINKYINGEHNIGYHRDDEKELGENPVIAGLSFGQERDILFKNKNKNILKKYILENGSLIIMRDPTNKYWYHSIPKRKKVNNIRISITFRYVIN